MTAGFLDLISDINGALIQTHDVRANMRSALELIRAALDLSSAIIFLKLPDSEKLTIAAAAGLAASDFRRIESRVGNSIFEKVVETGKPLTTKRIKDDPAFSFLDASSNSTLYAVPLLLEGNSLGVLSVILDADKKDHNKLFSLISSMIAQTLRIEHSIRGERQKLIEENSHLKQELKEKHEFTHIIGTSNPMKHVYDQVTQVARSNATVLLRGESGTGKEMIANAIHYNSLRSKRPLIKINCAALPDTLIESELFGHEKGAFTGADKFKKGRFEMADGGTLFLDEIGDLPLQTQIKLLRVLQEREFERLGGGETIRTNIRLVTATNKNLEDAIAKGDFREDLYYRLNVFTIHLPPLRERKSDILLLAEHFLEKYEIEHGKRIRRISTPAIDMLMSYHFPGNVRELENAIERAVLVCDANVIHGHHLPPTLQTAEISGTVTNATLASAVEAFERGMIQDTLKSTGGNVAKAAKTLDSTERILGYKIKKYGIDTMRFRRQKPER